MTGLYENDVGITEYRPASCGLLSTYSPYESTADTTGMHKAEYEIWRDYAVGATTTNSYITNSCISPWYDTGTATATTYSSWKEIDNLTTATQWYRGSRVVAPVMTPGERMREILRSRHAPAVHRRTRTALFVASDARELRARSTLCNILGQSSFRRFLRDGFITVVAKSGLTYRIYPGHKSTEVWDKGKRVESMCVVLKGRFPPTDELIMRYLLILNDEGEFSKHAVRSQVWSQGSSMTLTLPQPVKSLPELFADLKAVA